MQWSRGLYLAGIVLALVAVVPIAWFPFTLLKVALFAALLVLSAVCFVAGGGVRELAQTHGLRGALLVALLPVSYLVSMYFATDRSLALTGYSVEVDTVLFASLAALAFFMAFVHFRTLRTARQLLGVVLWALVAAALFQLVSVAFGAIPLSAFADRSVNLIGKWNDLGILVGLLVLLFLVRTELSATSRIAKWLYILFGAALLVLLAVINFAPIWGILLAVSLAVALVSFLGARRMPVLPLALAAVSVGFLVWGSSLNVGLTKLFPVTSLEVRPSWSATTQTIDAERGTSLKRLLVGTGPSTFTESWIMHKPAEVNQSQFWNLDFSIGYSSLLTAYGTVGVLGVVAWLIPALLVLAGVLRALRLRLIAREDRDTTVALTLAALLLWAAFIVYVPSANLVLFAMTLSGAAFGFLWRQGQTAAAAEPTTRAQWAALVLMLVVVMASAWAAAQTGRRLVAEALVGHGSVAISTGNVDTGRIDASRALAVETTADTLRFAISADSAKLSALSQDTKSPATEVQQQFASIFQETTTNAQKAHALNPADYRPVLAMGQLYDFLAGLKVQGAAAQAKSAYAVAAELNPTNPQIPLLQARLAAETGDNAAVQDNLKQALTLKPNYTDAMLLVVQLAVANNDLKTAVQAAQAAVQTAPGVPSLWFELGLLVYSGNDTKDAIIALEQALKLQPDYANAQYFLGLSYYAQGRAQDGIAQFQKLAASNPDNSEVKLILANMQAGKKPFDGATPPASTPPQDRTTAPVQQ